MSYTLFNVITYSGRGVKQGSCVTIGYSARYGFMATATIGYGGLQGMTYGVKGWVYIFGQVYGVTCHFFNVTSCDFYFQDVILGGPSNVFT